MTTPRLFEDVGPIGEHYANKDWSTCALGPPATWSPALQGYVDMVLRMPNGAIIFWGPDQIQLYNQGYSQIMGPRHPKYLGGAYRDCWPDTYPTIYPWMRQVMDEGKVIEVERALIPVTRYGFTEETYFTFSFVPLRDTDGSIAGFIQPINEVTKVVLAERRLATLRSLSPRVLRDVDAITQAKAALAENLQDTPLALLYITPDDSATLQFAGAVGIAGDVPSLAAVAAEVAETRRPQLVEHLAVHIGELHLGPWPEPTDAAMVLPLLRSETAQIAGAIVLGISPRLEFDETYRVFFESCARELGSNLTFEREERRRDQLAQELQRRAEALTELDRVKTAFFSNVSHEFRTPLTLMLGPLDDALSDEAHPLDAVTHERIELVRRNGDRLFKLVNSLLDFSRIEARRTQAAFVPTDLATLTADLASSFRSLVERAGLKLVVECAPLPEPIWVDHEMWEKIVLNLLSNAFKFTLAGEIAVTLRAVGRAAELRVRDTGVGIPANEVGKVFERFHRVEGAKGRSFEGSGIGLALVRELVHLHGGETDITSTEGVGTTLIVRLPAGTAHLPADQLANGVPRQDLALASTFVREASTWVHGDSRRTHVAAPADAPRIVLADDNADMREYVHRLLAPHYRVEAVTNGREALAAIARERPALVLSDVMMPEVDGLELLARLKDDPATQQIPVVLLSARAAEEARVEGMQARADDYMAKPFSARELVARVAARLEIARIQRSMSAELERLVQRRTEALQLANRELESFSYSVSHDLRAPLRHIVGFAQLLEKALGKLEEPAARHLRKISDAAVRGGQLVDDLLAFSRMGRTEMLDNRVSLADTVRALQDELSLEQEGRTVEWQVGALPEVRGDAALLRLVLKNLMSNALKYTRPVAIARISITGTLRDDHVEVAIADNGVGFDMRYVDKLFGVFQRLHAAEEFEGNGIGLALVRRIIQRHGGRTWAEGRLGEGATIYFTLPA